MPRSLGSGCWGCFGCVSNSLLFLEGLGLVWTQCFDRFGSGCADLISGTRFAHARPLADVSCRNISLARTWKVRALQELDADFWVTVQSDSFQCSDSQKLRQNLRGVAILGGGAGRAVHLRLRSLRWLGERVAICTGFARCSARCGRRGPLRAIPLHEQEGLPQCGQRRPGNCRAFCLLAGLASPLRPGYLLHSARTISPLASFRFFQHFPWRLATHVL